MSKRYNHTHNENDSKKLKLDLSSINAFSLNENGKSKNDVDSDPWGDENDDELLLLASQVCDPALGNIHTLPDYTICMKPSSTSTQIEIQAPGTSKEPFKVPSVHLQTRNINRISSPLHGLIRNVPKNIQIPSSNASFNEKICASQNPDDMYHQLLQYREENVKLKSELGVVLEKCATKEGEASILRSQLKSCQVNLDMARIDKVKTQENLQLEYTEKLEAAKKKIKDLKTELEFKGLEMINIKEKCKMLDSNKINLTQVLINNNEMSSRVNQTKKVDTNSQFIQTENKMHFLKLNTTNTVETSQLHVALPTLLEATHEQYPVLEHNKKLFEPNICSKRRTVCFRDVATHAAIKPKVDNSTFIKCVKENLTRIAISKDIDISNDYVVVLQTIRHSLEDIRMVLESVSKRVTTSFLRELNEKYIESTDLIQAMQFQELLSGRLLYEEEQGVLGRRAVATLCCLVQSTNDFFDLHHHDGCMQILNEIIDLFLDICRLLDATSCTILYSGLVLSFVNFISTVWEQDNFKIHRAKLKDSIRILVFSRPLLFVIVGVVKALRLISVSNGFLQEFCLRRSSSNMKLDYEQGVLIYRNDSCTLQVFLRQVEVTLKCVFKQKLTNDLLEVTRNIIALNFNIHTTNFNEDNQTGCECDMIFLQVVVYALMLNSEILKCTKPMDDDISRQNIKDLEAICRCGVRFLYRHIDSVPRLGHYEGYVLEFCNSAKGITMNEMYSAMLTEILTQYQTAIEDVPASYHTQAWVQSFQDFALTD